MAAVAGLVAATPAAAADKPALSKDPIRYAVGVDPAFSAIYLAKQQNLFDKAGINVKIVQYTQGGDAVDAVIANQADVVSSAESTVMIRATRGDVRALGVYSQSGSYIKFVARKGIDDVKQVKKFGVVAGSVSEFSTVKLLNKYGIDEKSVEFVKAGPPEFPALLARGSVDGYFLWEPWPANGVKQGGKILATSGDVGYVYNMWVAASGPWLDKHKAEAHALMKALAQACDELRAHPEKAGEASQKEIKLPAAQANELLKGVEWKVRDFTPADIATYKAIADFQVSRKITATKADVDKVVQKGFVSN
jgi:NitT/TauT family transport system substrate-binding protein